MSRPQDYLPPEGMTRSPNYDPAKIQTRDGEIQVDAMRWNRFWSSALVASDQITKSVLFNYGKGQTVAGDNTATVKADERHTNLNTQGQMPTNQAFAICRISIEFAYDIAFATIGAMIDNMYYEFFIGGDNPILRGLGRQFPGGIGIWGHSTINAREWFTHGQPGADNYHDLPKGQEFTIRPGTNYRVEQHVKGATPALGCADILVRMVWDGFHIDSVNG